MASPSELKRKGNELYTQGNLVEAAEYYGHCIEAIRSMPRPQQSVWQSDLVLAYSNRCQIRLKQHSFREALADAEDALKLDGEHVKTFFRKARALYGLGDDGAAVHCLREVVAKKSGAECGELQQEAIKLLSLGSMQYFQREKHRLMMLAIPDGHQLGDLLLGSGTGGRQLDFPVCANWGCGSHASKDVICAKCNLVSFCSLSCKKLHSEAHNTICCEDIPSKWRPKPFQGVEDISYIPIWGKVPACSLINSQEQVPADLKLCFAASGDLRDVITTICSVPREYSGSISILVDDASEQIGARNFLVLEMLRKYGKDAIDAVIALWYSNSMTQQQSTACVAAGWDILKRSGFLERTAATIAACQSYSAIRGPPVEAGIFQGGGDSKLSLDVSDGFWTSLMFFLQSKATPSSIKDARLKKCNYVPLLASLPDDFRAAWCLFNCHAGLMMPFSQASGEQATTQFAAGNKFVLEPFKQLWQLSSVGDPLCGWNYKDIKAAMDEFGVPQSDWYGGLFFHLRKILSRFVDILELVKVDIKLTDYDASDLTDKIKASSSGLFHRISTSNISDHNYIGLRKVLLDWGPLLVQGGTLVTTQLQWHLDNLDPRNLNMDKVEILMRKLLEIPPERQLHSLFHDKCKLENRSGIRLSLGILGWCHSTDKAYQDFMKRKGIDKIVLELGLKAKMMHQFVPPRIAVPVDATPGDAPVDYISDAAEAGFGMLSRSAFMDRTVEWTTK